MLCLDFPIDSTETDVLAIKDNTTIDCSVFGYIDYWKVTIANQSTIYHVTREQPNVTASNGFIVQQYQDHSNSRIIVAPTRLGEMHIQCVYTSFENLRSGGQVRRGRRQKLTIITVGKSIHEEADRFC